MADLEFPHNIKSLQDRGLLPLAWLPNQDGFEFIARFHDGTEQLCRVSWDQTRSMHCVNFMGTGHEYSELFAWRRP